MSAKAIVFGSHGFVGEHLVKRLEKDYEVLRGDREGNIPEKVEILYDVASYGNLWGQTDKELMLRVNVDRVGKLFHQNKYIKAVITSSSSVTMKHPTQYAYTKAAAEDLALEFGATVIRPYTVYGSGDNEHHLIPTVFRSCLYNEPMELDPTPTHDYIYIDDLVESYIDPSSKLVEAGTGVATTNGEVVQLIQKITGKVATILRFRDGLRPYDSKEWKAPRPLKDNMIKLEEGLRKIYANIKQTVEA
jgi:nucleoside-diphosphate-sugar epimerase